MNDMGVRIVIMMMLALMPAFSAFAQYRDVAGYQELGDSENVGELGFEGFHIIVDGMEGASLGRAISDTVAVHLSTNIVVVKILDDVLDILSLCGGQCDFGVVLYFHNFYFPFYILDKNHTSIYRLRNDRFQFL